MTELVLTANTYEIDYAEHLAFMTHGPATIRVKTLSNWYINLVKDDIGIMTLITYENNEIKLQKIHIPIYAHYRLSDYDSD